MRNLDARRWLDQLDTVKLTPRAAAMAAHLAGFMDEQGECWPSLPTLARRARASESTVKRGIRELHEAGVLRSRRRFNNSNVYRALLREDWPAQAEVAAVVIDEENFWFDWTKEDE